MIRKIFKTGHSAAVTLSSKALKALGLKLGDDVRVELDENRGELIIKPGHRQSQLALGLSVRPKLGQKR
jgi:antitoxin component of MazEF toxin-antitoxin module